jgi:hypothetical protein
LAQRGSITATQTALRASVVDLIAPFARPNPVDIAKYVLTSKGHTQPVVKAEARSACVVTTVANEDVIANRRLRVAFHPCSFFARSHAPPQTAEQEAHRPTRERINMIIK